MCATVESDTVSRTGSGVSRERKVSELYVRLSDTLVSGYDVSEFLQMLVEGCKDVLEVDVVGVLLEKRDGELSVSAASDEEMRTLEALELQTRGGPCFDAYTQQQQVVVEDLEACRDRWPQFVEKALDLGFRCGHAFPLRRREDTLGALDMYKEAPAPFTEDDVHLAQSLADIATIAIVNQRTVRDAEILAEQLQTALHSRVLIEQAKGVLAGREGISPEEAFDRIRRHCRNSHETMRDVSRQVVDEGFLPD